MVSSVPGIDLVVSGVAEGAGVAGGAVEEEIGAVDNRGRIHGFVEGQDQDVAGGSADDAGVREGGADEVRRAVFVDGRGVVGAAGERVTAVIAAGNGHHVAGGDGGIGTECDRGVRGRRGRYGVG